MTFSAPKTITTSLDSFAIIGNGSWATALVKIFSDNGNHVDWYVRKEEDLDYIKVHFQNPKYLRGLKFNPDRITPSNKLNTIISRNKWIILATPSAFLEETFEQIKVPLNNKIIVSGVKGILPNSKMLVGVYLEKKFDIKTEQIVVIAGPCHAEEIAKNRLSFLTLGCSDLNIALSLKSIMRNSYLNISVSKDVTGIEIAAVIKNIYAMVPGISKGLDYGDNFQSVLICNSIMEMKALLNKINPTDRNVDNTVYLGDLIVTAYSEYSRNRRFGELIGKGYSTKEALQKMKMIAEGYFATKNFSSLKQGIEAETPIIDSLYDILFKEESAEKTMKKLVKKLI